MALTLVLSNPIHPFLSPLPFLTFETSHFHLALFAASGDYQCQLSTYQVTSCSTLTAHLGARYYAVKQEVYKCSDQWRVALKTDGSKVVKGLGFFSPSRYDMADRYAIILTTKLYYRRCDSSVGRVRSLSSGSIPSLAASSLLVGSVSV